MIPEAVEFLISEGHDFDQIKTYSLPLLLLFVQLVGKRYERQIESSKQEKGTKNATKHYSRIKTSYYGS
jgi:hypothetical protein